MSRLQEMTRPRSMYSQDTLGSPRVAKSRSLPSVLQEEPMRVGRSKSKSLPSVLDAEEGGRRRRSKLSTIAESDGEDCDEQEDQMSMQSTASACGRFRAGDLVEVYSKNLQKWWLDGEIIEIAARETSCDGLPFGAGSAKVCFDGGRRFKWLGPDEVAYCLQPSSLPEAPERRTGGTWKHSRSWFDCWDTHVYMKASSGVLQWWDVEAMTSKRSGKAKSSRQNGSSQATDSLNLAGASAVATGGAWFKVRTGSGSGEVHSFRALSEADAQLWVQALQAHVAFSEVARDCVDGYYAARDCVDGSERPLCQALCQVAGWALGDSRGSDRGCRAS